jgi:hypothetical protein
VSVVCLFLLSSNIGYFESQLCPPRNTREASWGSLQPEILMAERRYASSNIELDSQNVQTTLC